jgi:lipoprotein NlpD
VEVHQIERIPNILACGKSVGVAGRMRGSFTGHGVSGWRLPALALVFVAMVLFGGCRALEPAPVERRGLESEAVPEGHLRVKSGETLYGVAWSQGLDYRRLAEWNAIPPPYAISPGQIIRVVPPVETPPAPSGPSKQKPKPTPAPAVGQKTGGKPKSTPVVSQKAKEKPTTAVPSVTGGEAPKPAPVARGWGWPVFGKVVQGYRRGDRTRQGIRISGPPGESVRAAEGGNVVYSGSGLVGYGNLIILKHTNDYLSAYGFNRKLLVKEGDTVARGEQVAELGQAPDGDYLLYFEIRYKGTAVDPLSLLPSR